MLGATKSSRARSLKRWVRARRFADSASGGGRSLRGLAVATNHAAVVQAVRVEQSGIRELRAELRAGSRRRDGTVIGATLLLGGLVWLAVGASLLPGLVLAGAGGLTIVFARRGG